MTKYVLEILDGPQKGTILAIDPEKPTTIGRKPNSALVLKDEKCSGLHAQVVHEDGGYVLRDLESRNGTILGGARVTEIVLSPFDVIQIGRTQIAFREDSQSMPTDDLSIATLDAGVIARRGGKQQLPIGAILVLLLLLGGGGAWGWIQFGGGGADGGGRRASATREPERLQGNRLAVGIDSFESDSGWILGGLESAGFEIVVGRSVAHTGETAIEAVHRPSEEDAPAESLAMARIAESIPVTSDSKLRVRAMMRTGGTGRAAVRLQFQSTEFGTTLTTGTVPTGCDDGWTEVVLEVGVPRGMDRAEVQLLALVPDDSAWVRADDVAVLVDRDSSVEPLLLTTDNGRMLAGAGATMRVTSGDAVVLEGVRPLVDDPLLRQLDRLGELVPSDAGIACSVAGLEAGGFRVGVASLGSANGVVLDFPSSAAGVLARSSSDEPFVQREVDFHLPAATEVVLGSEAARCALLFEQPVALHGKSGRNGYSLVVEGLRDGFAIRVRFEQEARRARELVRVAERAHRSGDFAAALDAVQAVVDEVPHVSGVLRQARSLRVDMLGQLGRRADALRREGAAARFFDARNGYQRVATGVATLIEEYGAQHVPQIETLTALADLMRAGIGVLDRAEAAGHRAELEDLAMAFDDAGNGGLTAAIRDYLARTGRAAEQPREGN